MLLQKVKFTQNQQIIKTDIDNIEDFGESDVYQYFKNVTNSTSLIVNGFKVFQDSGLTDDTLNLSPVYVELDGSTIIHTSKDTSSGDPAFYIGSEGTEPAEIELTSNSTNYIELDISRTSGASDVRTFYDPSNDVSFSQSVDTAYYVDAVVTVNTTGWSGGNKVSIAEIEVDADGFIVAAYDRRNEFYRKARGNIYDGDYKFPYPNGRSEALHTLTFGTSGSSAYLFIQGTPSTTWTINHALEKQYVSFSFYDESNQLIIPNTVNATTTNTLTATFLSAQAGRCIITIGTPASQYYDFAKPVAATTWTINHSLGTQYVNIRCYDASDNYIVPDSIEAIDANNIEVTFLSTQAGNAFITEGGNGGDFTIVNQGSSSATWNINHGLNTRYVDVTTYNSSDLVFYPSIVEIVDENNITITLISPDTGNVAVGAGGGGGEYLDGETIVGADSGITATVVSGGTTTITVESKSLPSFIVGELITGQTSTAANNLLTVKESFVSGDKSITTLKEMLDAIMTEIMMIKHGDTLNKSWTSEVTDGLDQIKPKASGYITNSGTPTLVSGKNVASLTSLSAGRVEITFEEELPNANYTVVATLQGTAGFIYADTKTTTTCVIQTQDTSEVDTDLPFNFIIHEGD